VEQRKVATDIIAVKAGKIALIKRKADPFKGYYALPGGGVDPHETVEEAALRELKEETNLDGKIDCLVGFYDSPDRDPRHAITFAYVVSAEGELKAADDATEAEWFDLENLPPLAFDHAKIIEDYKAGKCLGECSC
jgi:8-oxo-dGTP diphosphatase